MVCVCVCVCVCVLGVGGVSTKLCCERRVHDVKTLPIIFTEGPTFITLELKHVKTRNSFQNCTASIALTLLRRCCQIVELIRLLKE